MVKKTVLISLAAIGAVGAAFSILPKATSAPRRDVPFKLGNTTWPSYQAFKKSFARCGTRGLSADEMQRVESDLALTQQVQQKNGILINGRRTLTVPVYFHVITDAAGAGNLTKTQIQGQIDFLNKSFAGQDKLSNNTTPNGAAANTSFRFVLAGTDTTANTDWYNVNDETAMKTALRKGDAKALNLYSCNIIQYGLLGWATFPSWYSGNPKDDGVVLDPETIPGGSFAPYNLGDTATHEIGHWLGLYHTFQGGCSRINDMVSDTAIEARPFFGTWPPVTDSCVGFSFPGKDPVENYMDYTDDAFMYKFTTGQNKRMELQSITYRGY